MHGVCVIRRQRKQLKVYDTKRRFFKSAIIRRPCSRATINDGDQIERDHTTSDSLSLNTGQVALGIRTILDQFCQHAAAIMSMIILRQRGAITRPPRNRFNYIEKKDVIVAGSVRLKLIPVWLTTQTMHTTVWSRSVGLLQRFNYLSQDWLTCKDNDHHGDVATTYTMMLSGDASAHLPQQKQLVTSVERHCFDVRFCKTNSRIHSRRLRRSTTLP